jgi:hypothetical protein
MDVEGVNLGVCPVLLSDTDLSMTRIPVGASWCLVGGFLDCL